MFEEHNSAEEHVATSFRCAHQVLLEYKYKTSARVNILSLNVFNKLLILISSYLIEHILFVSQANTHSKEQ